MAIKRVDRVGRNIEAIESALNAMLIDIEAELKDAVDGNINATDLKTNLESILSEIDAKIINNSDIKACLSGDDEVTRGRVSDLIQDVQDSVRDLIDQFKDQNQGKALSEDAAKEVEEVFKSKVVGSETVKRTKVLDEFREQSDSIAFGPTADRLSATKSELEQVEYKLNKIKAAETQIKAGETLEQAVMRLSKDAESFSLKGNDYYTKMGEITKTVEDGGYNYEAEVAKIAVQNYTYKNQNNCELVSKFLDNLSKLKEGNPEIETIFTELDNAGIRPNKKDGKYKIKPNMGLNQRTKLKNALNKKLSANPIDFKKARENTAKAYAQKIDDEINQVISSNFMKLYPEELKKWTEMLAKADANKDDIWDEMEKFFEKDHDVAQEIEDIKDFEDLNTLEDRKKKLEEGKKKLENYANGERIEEIQDNLTQIQVKGIDIKSGSNLVGLSEEEINEASEIFYNARKAEFEKQFDKLADPKWKKIGFFEKLGYAISHRTLHPGQAIKAERVEAWARTLIADTISNEAKRVEDVNKKEKEMLEKFGALTPEQLEEFRKKEAKILEDCKKTQREAILEGHTKTADDASKNAKKDAEDKALEEK